MFTRHTVQLREYRVETHAIDVLHDQVVEAVMPTDPEDPLCRRSIETSTRASRIFAPRCRRWVLSRVCSVMLRNHTKTETTGFSK